jgi:hypothetical protein
MKEHKLLLTSWYAFNFLCASSILYVFEFRYHYAMHENDWNIEMMVWRTETANQRGGSEWEPIKIRLEGDRGSNKMNTASNTHLRLNYLCWSRPHSHWSATDPRNQQTTFRAKTHQHTQRKLARLGACATPVRPMACAGQTGGQSRSGRCLQ